MSKLQIDALVLGAGPAGSAFALNLAPFQKVLMVDVAPGSHLAGAGFRIGESLPAAAGKLLADMGLYEEFVQQGHLPARLNTSNWGGENTVEQDSMRNLDGHGWYLDRLRFDAWLQEVAQGRGAALLRQARLASFQAARENPEWWDVLLEVQGKNVHIETKMLIDASGRKSLLTRQQGIARKVLDKLVCSWVAGVDCDRDDSDSAGVSHICAEEGGWWYTSSLPGRGRIVGFYTDADLPQAGQCSHQTGLLQRLNSNIALTVYLQEQGFVPGNHHGFCAAHSAMPDSVAGTNWLAVGDAALSFDPLSSQGIFNALYTGLAAAEAVSHYDAAAQADYAAELASIQAAYLQHLKVWYQQEQRWAEQPFWQRRNASLMTA
ncbi:tryptophan 7-halogenase [Undibacterium sp. TS12]|uniref:tryptophan 7-halogenase n=1 Tax=Undibacterium sp. TS12 TaxID=2908202 RepID=UPI001F4CE963|nr:tryptophan 7-halogenase [Undibacterium sp. TS12]MCH8620005.1 NAD(P)/FAD-dependent oxidoreductase [Undibacterium sp. TS12]